MTLRWFFSSRVRRATEIRNHIRKLFNHQRDLLPTAPAAELAAAINDTSRVIATESDPAKLDSQIAELEKTAEKRLKAYPNADLRENVEVLLVAIAVAMAIRTFFVQPFKIPTGSMQPTLFGITYENLRDYDNQTPTPKTVIPNWFGRVWDVCVHGVFYHQLVAKDDGEIVDIPPKEPFLHFFNSQKVIVNYKSLGTKAETIWMAPDDHFVDKTGLRAGQAFSKGDYIVKLKEISGDHLFVDRVTYNFRHPKRGEIVVFETRGIQGTWNNPMPQDQFYIKRLVALGGESVQIGKDDHLIINGKRLDASTPHFENVYSFTGERQSDHYHGHVASSSAIAPLFYDGQTYHVDPFHFLVMGDNTMNSFDSRFWGQFSETNVIGKSLFVYWPIANHEGSRFGWSVR
jgi:signal peptidase I